MKHDDDFTRVGDLLPVLIPAAKDISPRRKPGAITKAQIDLLNATAAYQAQEYGREKLAYMPSQLVQCTFPHDDPGTVPAWSRSTPWLTVTFQPGYRIDPRTKQPECIGYPYGTIPRLLMFYVKYFAAPGAPPPAQSSGQGGVFSWKVPGLFAEIPIST